MLDFTMALVGAGPLPELSMREGAQLLAQRLSAELVPIGLWVGTSQRFAGTGIASARTKPSHTAAFER